MSLSALGRLLTRFLSRFLNLFLPSIRRLPPHKLINHLFAFFASLRPWTRPNPRRPTVHQHRRPPAPSATLDSGVVCAMNVPSSGPSDAHEPSQHSPVDLPYFNARSPSGGHLIPPHSPTPRRHYSRDDTPRFVRDQTTLHEEPTGINHDALQDVAESIPYSCTTDHRGRTPGSDIPAGSSRSPTPLLTEIGFALEMSPENSRTETPPHATHIYFNPIDSESHRSRTPLSMKSSQRSISQRSYRSAISIGRASYREHHGTPARVLTSVLDQGVSISGPLPSPTLGTAKPSGSAALGAIIAPPSANDPNQPGEPVLLGPRFLPISANGVLRYDKPRIRPPFEHDYNIEAMSYQYPETPQDVPEGWKGCLHPEGTLYFVHTQSKTFTEVDICNEDIHADIEFFRNFLFSELQHEIDKRNLSGSLKANEVQLVLEPKSDDLGVMCCYYFVNPQTRCLFWLDEWNGHEIFKDVRGIRSSTHKGLAIQAHYWHVTYVSRVLSHWNLYPNFCEITQELKNEVVHRILHATCDHFTSNRSSLPLNPEELKNHLSLIEKINPETARDRGHCAVMIGRIMHIFYSNYFINFHGEDCARLNFDEAIHGWRYHPSLRMTILAPLLFMTPVNNVRLLHRVFVDDIVSKDKWNMFVSRLNSQLQETSVLATVLLNANVGFLPKQSGIGTSPQQYLSYVSLVTSMASIILGLVFMGHSRTEERNTPFKAATFLDGLRHERHGLEILAIIYSLPQAFLMWGMMFFSAAFAFQWSYPGDTTSRTCVGVFMLIVAFLVVWCIWTVRDRCHFWWFQPDPEQKEYEKSEDEEGNNRASFVIPWSSHLRKFTSLFPENFLASKPPLDEIHVMEDTTSHPETLDP